MVRIVPAEIKPISPRIFVFGSNLAGRHGKGAALHARKHYGAESGVAIGHIGHCYAIPTKDQMLRPLSMQQVEHFIASFLAYANYHPELKFNVTKIGCGLAGFTDRQIAPLFERAPPNCYFDQGWKEYLPGKNFWEPPI